VPGLIGGVQSAWLSLLQEHEIKLGQNLLAEVAVARQTKRPSTEFLSLLFPQDWGPAVAESFSKTRGLSSLWLRIAKVFGEKQFGADDVRQVFLIRANPRSFRVFRYPLLAGQGTGPRLNLPDLIEPDVFLAGDAWGFGSATNSLKPVADLSCMIYLIDDKDPYSRT